METPSIIPNEILSWQILPRLPAKSLVRFRSVCKLWNSLFHNPSFISLHRELHSHGNSKLLLFFYNSVSSQLHLLTTPIHPSTTTSPPRFDHLLTIPSPNGAYFAQSVNGLVFFQSEIGSSSFSERDTPENVINPSNHQIINLPDYGFQPTHQSSHHFGHDPITNEYKVLVVCHYDPNDTFLRDYRRERMRFLAKILVLPSRSWRNIEFDLPFHPTTFDFNNVALFINGSMHWVNWYNKAIVAFDVGQEKFSVIPFPDCYEYDERDLDELYFGHLVEVGGCLALIGDKLLLSRSVMELWVLEDYENHIWVKKENISFPFDWVKSGRAIPVGTVWTGELLFRRNDWLKNVQGLAWVYYYDMKMRSFKINQISFPEWLSSNSTFLCSVTCYDDNITLLT